MQNDLVEFFSMVSFCNPDILGSVVDFKKKYERPILASRELDAPQHVVNKALVLQNSLSSIVNEFILKRGIIVPCTN